MSEAAFENLDLICAKWGQQLAQKPSDERENLLRNALAVLEEQGVYALFLYLHQEKQAMSNDIFKKLQEFLQQNPRPKPLLAEQQTSEQQTSEQQTPEQQTQREKTPEQLEKEKKFLEKMREKLTNDLDKLLLAQDLLRQTLVYALYHVRAKVEVQQS